MGRMLISREAGTYAEIDAPKVRSGRFLTRRGAWLLEPVREFLATAGATTIVDPFAGEGHLFAQLAHAGFAHDTIAYDLAPHAGQIANDSLRSIPVHPGAAIVTNPPYLARHSATRKGVLDDVRSWFDATGDRDLYQVALRRCLDAAPTVVAIVPETFLHAGVLRERLMRAVVVEDAMFDDTTTPVCVACFGPTDRAPEDIEIFLGDDCLGSLAELDARRAAPAGDRTIRFNDPAGAIALQAVDGVDPANHIAFVPRTEHAYDAAGIKHSSRLVTFVSLRDELDIAGTCARANALLAELRAGLGDLALSPFKGNDRAGRRRRRLDYRQARWLLTQAHR